MIESNSNYLRLVKWDLNLFVWLLASNFLGCDVGWISEMLVTVSLSVY